MSLERALDFVMIGVALVIFWKLAKVLGPDTLAYITDPDARKIRSQLPNGRWISVRHARQLGLPVDPGHHVEPR